MRKFIFSFAMFVVALFTVAQNQLPIDPAVRIGKLDNGMTYYIRHNSQPAQRAEFYLATNVGAFQETDDQDGLAHFLEHMCFNGTKNFPGKTLLNYLQGIGAEFGGNINASTGFEQTTYMLNNIPIVREGIIDSCLLVMHDYSHFVLLEQKEIDDERGVILEERRARRNATWRMFEKSLPYYYGGTPYEKRTLIGGEDQLKTFKRESLVNFYKTWYNPDMQAIIVVGDFDVDKMEAKIKKTFADIPKPAKATVKINHKIPDNKEPIIGVITDPEASSSKIEIMWKSEPEPLEMNSTDVGMFTDILKECISEIMNERLDDISSAPDAPFLSAGFDIDLLCNSCETVESSVSFKNGEGLKAMKALMIEIEKMKRFGFTDAEVERAKTNILSTFEKKAEAADSRKNPDFIRPILNNFFFNQYLLDPKNALQIAQVICGQINAQLINQIAPKLITDDNMVVLYKGPEKGIAPTEAQLKDVLTEAKNAEIKANAEEVSNEPLLDATVLKGAKSSAMKKGKFGETEWTLSNGVKVVVLPTQYKKDEINISLVKKGGRSLIETADLPSFDDNVWSLYLYNKGLSKFSNSQLKKMLTGKNVTCNPSIRGLEHSINAKTTPKDLETAFQLMYLNFTDQRFSADEFKLGINQIEAVIGNLVKQPNYQLQKFMYEKLYNNNPRKQMISEATVKAANIATLERVYRQLFNGANGATLYIVGNVDINTVKPLVEKYIGSIAKGKDTPSMWIDRHEYIAKGKNESRELIDMTTPKSTVYQLYTASLPYSVKNSVLLDMCKYVLDMVYVATLREAEGGTYSPSLWADFEIEPKPMAELNVMFETNPEMEARLAKMAKDELAKVAKNGITNEQMQRTLENFKKNIPEFRISNRYWMQVLQKWNDKGINFDSEYEAAVNNATKAEINTLLNDILKQNNFFELIVAPKQASEKK